jgi:hypothetical protein
VATSNGERALLAAHQTRLDVERFAVRCALTRSARNESASALPRPPSLVAQVLQAVQEIASLDSEVAVWKPHARGCGPLLAALIECVAGYTTKQVEHLPHAAARFDRVLISCHTPSVRAGDLVLASRPIYV